ncbi:MAG: GtrA family protein [Nanoarchaeota archaeon]|nr:GtrA family protein [Nanoarchaeota archaeon]
MIKKNFWRFVIFCFIGVSSALVDLIVFNILMFFFNFEVFIKGVSFNFIISTIIATCVAVIYNFNMNRNITFSAKHGSLKKQLFRYTIVYGVAISVNFLVSFSVVALVGETIIKNNFARIIGIAVSIPISYLGSLLWTFKKDEDRIIVS